MPNIRSVSDIKSNLLRPSLTSVFEVQIGLPGSSLGTRLRSLLGTDQRKLNLMCSEAVLPGSSLATTEVNNDYTGVTERHAYRRIYDETIDLSFYVDAVDYLPIKFFEEWISGIVNEDQNEAKAPNYFYRVQYPDDYVAAGLKVIKFEKDYTDQYNDIKMTGGAKSYRVRTGTRSKLEYEFIRSYPRSITSMPVSYDGSSLLKCSVQMTYVRYVLSSGGDGGSDIGLYNPFQQAQFNSNGIRGVAANLVDAAVDRITGNDFLGDVAGAVVGGGLPF
tara:strand:+ start:396 stop:1223 length:828 start_codon:yes stop_codon:yes gene_type:complete